MHGLISHLEEGTCSKIFYAVEEYAAAKDSIERAAAVRSPKLMFPLISSSDRRRLGSE